MDTHTHTHRNSYVKTLLRFGWRSFLALIPENRFGDRVLSYILFAINHRRLPTQKLVFNDVLFQIKTTDEILNPLRVFVSDKEFVKLYVKALLDEKYNVPTIAVLENIDQVDSFTFPDACCIKTTHASGYVIIRRGGEDINRDEIKRWFSINYYRTTREVNYKTLKPKVIVEPLIFSNNDLVDFKFFCFNGEPKFIQVDIDRYANHTRKFFDVKWKELDFSILYPKSEKPFAKPNNFDEMLSVTKALSKNFSMIRVDLYSNENEIYVGELTNVPGNACSNFIPPKAEVAASKLLFGNHKL
jgi:hypothetical protein